LAAETSQSKAKPDGWHTKGVKYQDTFTQSLAQRSGSEATSSASAAVLEGKSAGTPAAPPAPATIAASTKISPLAEALQAKLLSLPAPPSTVGPSEPDKTAEKTSTPSYEAKNTEANSTETNSKELFKTHALEPREVAPASAVDVKPAEERAAKPADTVPVTERITSKKHKPAVLTLGDCGDAGNPGDPGNLKDPAPVAPAPVITAAQSRGLSKQQSPQVAAPVETPPRAGGTFAAPVGTAIGTAIAAPVGKSPSAELKDSTTEPADSESKPLRGWSTKPAASLRSAFDESGSASLSSEPELSASPSPPVREMNKAQSAFSPWTSNSATHNPDGSIPPAPTADELAPVGNPTMNPDATPDSSEPPATLHADTTGAALESVPSGNAMANADVAAPRMVLQMVKIIGLRKPTDAGQSSSDSEPSRFTLKEPAKITEPAKLIEPAFGAALPAEAATPTIMEPAAESAAPALAARPVDAKTSDADPQPGLLDNSAAKDLPNTATHSAPTPGGELVGSFPAATANAAPSPPSAFPMTVAEVPPSPAESTAPTGNTAPGSVTQLPALVGQPASNAAADDGAKLGSVVVLRRNSASHPSDKTAEAVDQSPVPPAVESLSSGSRFAEWPAGKIGANAESNSSDSIATPKAADGKSVDSGESHIAGGSKTQSGPFSLAELSKHIRVPALTGGSQSPQPQGSDESAKLVSAPVPPPGDAAEAAESTGSTRSAPKSETDKADSSKAETSRLVAPPSATVNAPSLLTAAPAPSPDQTKNAVPASPTATGMPAASTAPGFASLAVPGAEQITIAPRETRSIHLDAEATRAESLDPRVCDVIQFAPHELTFVGKQPGFTRIDCWQDGKPDSRKSYLVAVGVDPTKGQQVRDQCSKMRVALQEMYPDSGINVTENNGSLVVSGTAASKAEAIAILSLVRRMQTVPVVDALAVGGR
jgi:hypothetical protein